MTSDGQLRVEIKSEHCFREGECFDTYEQFLGKLEHHSASDLVFYWRRDSRTIEGATLKTARPIAEALRYYSVRYSCVYGGQKFETKSTGAKKIRSSLRKDCPAFISLRASKCGQKLVVVGVSNTHNHEISVERAKDLAHNKKLSAEMKKEVQTLLFHNVDRKLIKAYVRLKDGKDLNTKDLCNLAATLRRSTEFRNVVSDPNACMTMTTDLVNFIQSSYTTQCDPSFCDVRLNSLELEVTSNSTEMLEERLLEDFDEDSANGIDAGMSSDAGKQESNLVHSSTVETRTEDCGLLEGNSNASYGENTIVITNLVRKRTRWKPLSCFACVSNNRIVGAKIEVLRARRDKLREEIRMLRLKKKKMLLELRTMKRD